MHDGLLKNVDTRPNLTRSIQVLRVLLLTSFSHGFFDILYIQLGIISVPSTAHIAIGTIPIPIPILACMKMAFKIQVFCVVYTIAFVNFNHVLIINMQINE